MKFYKYWAKATEEVSSVGQRWKAQRFAGSNESVADARANAHKLAQKTAEALRRGDVPDSYLYSDRPVREEIVEAFGDDENPYAIITRNGYGSLVLNTARILFADVDDGTRRDPFTGELVSGEPFIPPIVGKIARGLMSLLGGVDMDELQESAPTPEELIHEFAEENPHLGIRIYRTAAGFRCMITSQEYDPSSSQTQSLLEELHSDPLYVKLCQVQQCFRARLTPKFWRCELDPPPVRFPWADALQEQAMRAWEQSYSRGIAGYATCELLETLGPPEMTPQIESIVQLHDQLCCGAGKPLA